MSRPVCHDYDSFISAIVRCAYDSGVPKPVREAVFLPSPQDIPRMENAQRRIDVMKRAMKQMVTENILLATRADDGTTLYTLHPEFDSKPFKLLKPISKWVWIAIHSRAWNEEIALALQNLEQFLDVIQGVNPKGNMIPSPKPQPILLSQSRDTAFETASGSGRKRPRLSNHVSDHSSHSSASSTPIPRRSPGPSVPRSVQSQQVSNSSMASLAQPSVSTVSQNGAYTLEQKLAQLPWLASGIEKLRDRYPKDNFELVCDAGLLKLKCNNCQGNLYKAEYPNNKLWNLEAHLKTPLHRRNVGDGRVPQPTLSTPLSTIARESLLATKNSGSKSGSPASKPYSQTSTPHSNTFIKSALPNPGPKSANKGPSDSTGSNQSSHGFTPLNYHSNSGNANLTPNHGFTPLNKPLKPSLMNPPVDSNYSVLAQSSQPKVKTSSSFEAINQQYSFQPQLLASEDSERGKRRRLDNFDAPVVQQQGTLFTPPPQMIDLEQSDTYISESMETLQRELKECEEMVQIVGLIGADQDEQIESILQDTSSISKRIHSLEEVWKMQSSQYRTVEENYRRLDERLRVVETEARGDRPKSETGGTGKRNAISDETWQEESVGLFSLRLTKIGERLETLEKRSFSEAGGVSTTGALATPGGDLTKLPSSDMDTTKRNRDIDLKNDILTFTKEQSDLIQDLKSKLQSQQDSEAAFRKKTEERIEALINQSKEASNAMMQQIEVLKLDSEEKTAAIASLKIQLSRRAQPEETLSPRRSARKSAMY